MEIKIPTLADMPTPVKVGVLLASGGGIGAAVVYIPKEARVMVAAGIALVGFILLLYSLYLKGRDRRKAAPMERGVLEGASSVPAGISEPARRARLDDLHKKFQTGIERYRAAGKNLYEFPWYLVVGEPGSGKTEAIRHCNIGFPPGLQDELQGVGGTVNMNWWFTDHAVILDTAGRMMFEEIEAGGSEEWKEFLRLLRRYRPNCPINGVFLFIPADSLVKDTADTIEQKAKKISLQFDMIQRTLDVRFPVYIVISKSDLMYGFRDFFEGVEDPELQHQILGWSNESSLDEPYNPELLEQHLGAVRHRLLRRRSGLLQQAGVEIDAEGEMLRQAEGFYAFPLSLGKLVPRMARYLELIFAVGSKWSLKPLFFRGIYFTSAMQQGSALDQDLAGALGVPVDSLPDGRVWMREKAFFLRDLFLKKVFPEKGLVTRATNATRLYIRRKAAVLLAAVISVIALLSFTVFAYLQWKGSVGDLKNYLTVAQTQIMVKGQPIIVDDKYDGGKPVADKNVKDILDEARLFYLELAESVKHYISKEPWIFYPATFLGGGKATGSNLADALATVYETGVLKPLMKKAADDITKLDSKGSGSWVPSKGKPSTGSALQVLHDFLAIQAGIPLLGPTSDGKPTDAVMEAYQRGYTIDSFLDPLFQYGGVPEEVGDDPKLKRPDRQNLRDAFRLVYYDEKSDKTRPIQAIDPDLTMTHALVAAFEKYWDMNNPNDPDLKAMKLIGDVSGQLDEFKKAEGALREVVSSSAQKDLDIIHHEWLEKFKALTHAYEQLNKTVPILENANGKSLVEAWTGAEGRVNKNLTDSCKFLTNDLGAIARDSELGKIRERIQIIPEKLVASFKGTLNLKDLEDLDGRYYAKAGDPKEHLYAIRYKIYRNALLESDPNKAELGLSFTIEDIKEKKGKGITEIGTSQTLLSQTADPLKEPTPGSDATKALNIAEKVLVRRAVNEFLKNAPKEVAAIEGLVLKKSEGQNGDKGTGLPPTESNECKSERRYHPRFATEYINDWFLAGDILGKAKDQDGSEVEARKSYDKITLDVNQYMHAYIAYWLVKYPDQLETTLVPVKAGVTRIDHWFMNLSDECKALTALGDYFDKTAITPIFDHISQDNKKLVQVFREELESINNKNLRIDIEELLNSWRKPNVQNILTEKLADVPGLVRAFFTPAFFEKVQSGQFVHLQIQKLIAESLDRIAQGFQEQMAKDASAFLNDYGNKFPLSWDATTELSQDQFFKARGLWAKYKNILPSMGGLPGNASLFNLFEKHSDEHIRQRLIKIETNLNQLNSLTLSEEDVKKFAGIGKMMDILPQDPAKPYFCRLTLKSSELLGQTRGTSVQQGSTRKLLEVITDSIIVQYPGNPLSFTFYAYADESQTNDRVGQKNYDGVWGCLRMIRFCPSDLVDVDGTKYRYIWIQGFNPDDGKMQDVMSFAVEFSDKDFSDNSRKVIPIPQELWLKRSP